MQTLIVVPTVLILLQQSNLSVALIVKFLSKNELGLMIRWITGYPITKDRLLSFKANGHTKTEKVSHGDLRDDRPSHGRDVRALMDDSGLNQKGCVSKTSCEINRA
jgi:hypothetical protein